MVIRNIVCLPLFALGILAQSGGTITGTVVNLSGDPVAKAVIQATNAETKAVYKATTSAAGVYTLAQLPAGTYQLASGSLFFELVERSVKVAAAETLQLNLHLVDVQLNTLGDNLALLITWFSPHKTPAGPTPRMPDGKPDLSGVWYSQRPVDPGKPEMKPWAEAIFKERAENNHKDFPQGRCQPLGVLLSGFVTHAWRTVHTSAILLMISEMDAPGYRQIYLDGRDHPKDPFPTWTGHSIGHWEADTLVVDTVGFNDKFWLSAAGEPHTEKLHLTERYHRPDLGHLEIEFTIEDPDTFVKPWVVKRVADLAPKDEEVDEVICTENERDREHMVGK
jgi:Carboxypeptidase regulatory-like domain